MTGPKKKKKGKIHKGKNKKEKHLPGRIGKFLFLFFLDLARLSAELNKKACRIPFTYKELDSI